MCVSLTGITPSPRAWTPLPHCRKVSGIRAVPLSHGLSPPFASLSLSLQGRAAYFTVASTI